MSALVWFRTDLRLCDNPALYHALRTHDKVYAVYIHPSPNHKESHRHRDYGGAKKTWLHHSLQSLSHSLEGALTILIGDEIEEITKFAKLHQIDTIYWNRRYDMVGRTIDELIEKKLKNLGIKIHHFKASLLFEPWEIKTGQGNNYTVFTPFWRQCLQHAHLLTPPLPTPSLANIARPQSLGATLKSLQLLPQHPNWSKKIYHNWEATEAAALVKLESFLQTGTRDYKEMRNYPMRPGTSGLSPYLSMGQISPRTIYHRVSQLPPSPGIATFLSEIGWREFSYHLLYYFPDFATRNFKNNFDHVIWDNNQSHLISWQKGMTGYPLVDAGMRELYATGWMHNRVRMITASFLIKDLLLDWRLGEQWFWDTLLDADVANNPVSWQWVAGCGADAAPYFRVFNPTLQGEKFDPRGDYVRHWCPELSALPDKFIHKPWLATPAILREAKVQLGITYPNPLVNHDIMKIEAIRRLKAGGAAAVY